MSGNEEQNQQIREAIATLERLSADAGRLAGMPRELYESLMKAAGRLSRPNRDEIRARNRKVDQLRRQKVALADRSARASTGIREARQQSVFVAPARIEPPPARAPDATTDGKTHLNKPKDCYVCKASFTQLHFFYDSMCPTCADFNYQKRFQTASLEGQVALITGGRLKIGYQAALMMLRAGARVLVTTRFPADAALRFSREADFPLWKDRLECHGLDLRHTPSVELFTAFVNRHLDRLDILINNAAQTVRRPPGFYAHLLENERKPRAELPAGARALLAAHDECKAHLLSLSAPADSNLPVAWHGQGPGIGLRASAELSQIPYSYDASLAVEEVFPKNQLDADLQQVDLRDMNSWRLGLADVPTPELLEVQLVNSIAPFVLCSKLAPLMRRNPTGQKHIVNVTAMEGKFHRFTKTDKHPHTNMAKAALNMLTHTSAKDLAKDGIYMNAVDTGWVTDEDPAVISQRKQREHDFQPPLDIVDGAARICDPFFHGLLTGHHWCGRFLKDYAPTDW